MTDKENTFSFAADTGFEVPASEPVVRAAHMAPTEPEPEPIGAHAAPVVGTPEPAEVPEVIGASFEFEPVEAAPLPVTDPLAIALDELESTEVEAPEQAAVTIDTLNNADHLAIALEELESPEDATSQPAHFAEAPFEEAAQPAHLAEPVVADMSQAAHLADSESALFEAEVPRLGEAATVEAPLDATFDTNLVSPTTDELLPDAPVSDALATDDPALEAPMSEVVDPEELAEDVPVEAIVEPLEDSEEAGAPAAPLPTASLDDTAEIDVEQVEAKLKDPGSTQSFEPITDERIDTDSTYDAGTTTTLMWGARSDVGCVRSHNEDSYLVQSPLFCVCDGMGGHAAGEVASSIAVETIAKTAPSSADAAQLAAAVEAANAAIIAAASNGLGKPGMGCTATCAYIEGNTIAIAHVGDSRAYLLHEDTLIRVTRDHSYVEELVDAGEITADEARVHPNRSVITRALGSDPAMYADHFCLNIEEGDRLILCSDGLSSMVPDGEIETIATKSSTAQICVDNLVDAALAAGGHDNVSVVVVDVVDDGRIKQILHRRRRNLIIAISAAVAALVIAAIVCAVSISNSVFLGVNSDETVAIYKGIHSEIFGLKLYQIEDTTSVKVYDLPDDTRSRLEEGIAQDSVEQARHTISEYRTQIDEDETKQVENAEAIRKSTDAEANSSTDSTTADTGSAGTDSAAATDTTQDTQGGA